MCFIYLDNLTDVELMNLVEAMDLIGTESDNQTVIRRQYDRKRVPRNLDKSLMRQIIAQRLGYLFNGFTAWMGISNKRVLDSLTLGLELLDEADVPLVLLQILAGKLGHALQARRAFWSLLYQ